LTTLDTFRGRLRPYNCDIQLGSDGQPKLVEYEGEPPTELMAEVRRRRAALKVDLLRERAWALRDYIDSDAPLAERLSRVAEYQEAVERLAEAEDLLFGLWRSAGFVILWSSLLEEFVLVGNGSPPPGSEGFVVYEWPEVEALKDVPLERVVAAHRVKKAFAGMVQRRSG
jgi:hypothetical protein